MAAVRCSALFGPSIALANAANGFGKIKWNASPTGLGCGGLNPFPETCDQVGIIRVLMSLRGCNQTTELVRDLNGVTAEIVRIQTKSAHCARADRDFDYVDREARRERNANCRMRPGAKYCRP